MAASPIFVHPVQNFSVVRFDPSTVKGAFNAAVLSLREIEADETESWCSPPPPQQHRFPNESGGTKGGDDARSSPEEGDVVRGGDSGGGGTTLAGQEGSLSVNPAESDGPLSLSLDCGGLDDVASPPPLRPGDAAEFHGLTSANAPVRQRTVVVKLERLSLTSSVHPQFTAHSVEVEEREGGSCPGEGGFV